MAIRAADIAFAVPDGKTLRSGALHDLFSAGRVDGLTDYRLVEVQNRHGSLTLSGVKAWLSVDSRGATVAIAVADGTARALAYSYDNVVASSLTYSTPTTQASGLALPSLGPGQKCLLAIRRTLTGASPASPETNRLNVSGTSPL